LEGGKSSGRRPSAADEPDEVLTDQDGAADATEEKKQHPDGVQVVLDEPEKPEKQP